MPSACFFIDAHFFFYMLLQVFVFTVLIFFRKISIASRTVGTADNFIFNDILR